MKLKSYLATLGSRATDLILYKNQNKETALHTAIRVDNHFIINLLLTSLQPSEHVNLSGL